MLKHEEQLLKKYECMQNLIGDLSVEYGDVESVEIEFEPDDVNYYNETNNSCSVKINFKEGYFFVLFSGVLLTKKGIQNKYALFNKENKKEEISLIEKHKKCIEKVLSDKQKFDEFCKLYATQTKQGDITMDKKYEDILTYDEIEEIVDGMEFSYDNPITLERLKEKGLTHPQNIAFALEVLEIATDVCEEYGEPGYKNPKHYIMLGNWNYITNEIFSLLEDNGYELEWDDEWIVDYNNSVCFRTQPNSWGWEPSYFIYDSEIYSIKGNEELYLEAEEVINNPRRIVSSFIDLSKLGFVELTENEDHCSGWYSYCETPQDFIDKNIPKEWIDKGLIEFVFQTNAKGQWSINWSVWVRGEKAKELLNKRKNHQ